MTKKWHHKTGMTKTWKTKWQKHDKKMTKINNQQPSEFAGKIFITLIFFRNAQGPTKIWTCWFIRPNMHSIGLFDFVCVCSTREEVWRCNQPSKQLPTYELIWDCYFKHLQTHQDILNLPSRITRHDRPKYLHFIPLLMRKILDHLLFQAVCPEFCQV